MRILIPVLIALLFSSAANAGEKPNIIYMLVDNWGWGDISVQGGTVPTPRIDSLAEQGLRLTNFNVQNQCTPTRSATPYRTPSDSLRNAKSPRTG